MKNQLTQFAASSRVLLQRLVRLFRLSWHGTANNFDSLKFGVGMLATYRGQTYNITGVNFMERLIELRHDDDAPDEGFWVREESAVIHVPNVQVSQPG